MSLRVTLDISQIDRLDKNAIEEKIIGYYVEGKLSEDHSPAVKGQNF